jgi:hypothetical protein
MFCQADYDPRTLRVPHLYAPNRINVFDYVDLFPLIALITLDLTNEPNNSNLQAREVMDHWANTVD